MKGRSHAKPRTGKSSWGASLAWVAGLAALALSLWLVSRALQQGGEARPKAAAVQAQATPGPWNVEPESDEVTREERRKLEELIDRRASGQEHR